MQQPVNKYSLLTAAVIMAVIITLRLSAPPKNILSYDVFGYYLYLPATFIYHDPALKDIGWVEQMNTKYNGAPSLYQLGKVSDTNYVIRFNAGIAVMYSPFFFLGHLAARILPFEADGFSKPYQWAIILGGLFYTLAGVWFLRKALLPLFSDLVTAITLGVIFLVSNVFFFSVWGNDAPHIYIFTLYALILYLTVKWYAEPKGLYAILLGLALGTAVITRPSEVFILLVPALWGVWGLKSVRDKLVLIWQRKRDVILIVLFTALAVAPQLIYWKYATGEWIFNSYDDPQSGFNFSSPRFSYVLFGFRKGFYVYSPVMIFATIGFYQLFRQKRKLFLPFLLFFLANVYLIASYSSLVSYGWRAFVQLHAVLAIPMACFVEDTLRQKKAVLLVALHMAALLLLLNVLKSYQTMRGIIDGSRMTRAYYFDSFFTVDPKKTDKSLLLADRSEESRELLTNEDRFARRVVCSYDFESITAGNSAYYDSSFSHSGKQSYRLGPDNIYSPAFEMPFKEITRSYYGWIRATVWIYKTGDPSLNESLLVVHFNYDHRPYKYRAVSYKNMHMPFQPGQWNRITIDYMTPEVRTPDDPLKVYVWYRGQGDVYIDDFTVEVFEPREVENE